MNWFRKHLPDFFIAAGFFILPLLLFANVTIGGKTMIPADNLYQWQPWSEEATALGAEIPHNGLLSDMVLENYAWKRFIRQSLKNREIPLWNSAIFAGTPFLATGQHSAYYPFSIIFLILPILQAYGWYTVIQLWLAGLFTYFFGRILNLQRASAAVAGLIFQGCGFILVSAAVFPMILGAAVWLPLLLACIEMVIRNTTQSEGAGKTLPWAAAGAIALGCQVLAGHIEITYYTLLVMAIYAAWRLVAVYFRLSENASRNNNVSAWAKFVARFGKSPIDLSNQFREDKENETAAPASQSQPFLPGRLNNGRHLLLLKPAGWLLILVVIGLMLGAIQFIPFVEVGQANFREGSATLSEVRGWAFPNRRLLTLALPDFFGNPADHSYVDAFTGRSTPFTTNYYGEFNPHGASTSNWGIKNYVEGGIYLGILPLFLALLGIYSAWKLQTERRVHITFFTVLSLFSLAFIFGTPLYAILYYGLPGINQLHSPFRWVFPFSLCIALLAGFGFDYLAISRLQISDWRAKRKTGNKLLTTIQTIFTLNRSAPTIITFLAGLAFWSGLLLLVGLFLSRPFYDSLEPLIERLFLGLAQAPDAFSDTRAFYSYEFRQLFLLGLMLVAAGCVLRVSRCRIYLFGRPIYEWMAVVAIGLDLLVAGYGFNAAVDPALLEYEPPLMQWLDQQPGLWRLTTFTPHGDKPINANTPWLYDYQDIRGYDSIILKQYTDYMAVIEPQNELQFNRVQPIVNWESLNSPLLDLLGVKYIISSEAIELPKLEEVWHEGNLRVYENLAVVPRAYTILRTSLFYTPDPLAEMSRVDPRQYVLIESHSERNSPPQGNPGTLQPAEITAYSNLEVKVQATVEEHSWLVLNDTYFTGWDAFVRPLTGESSEEEKVDIARVNGNFRGVLLDPGSWEVRFRYSPLSFKVGGLTSFMGGIIVLFALAVWAWRQFYNPEGELTNTRSIAKNSIAPMALNLFNRAIDFGFAAFYLRLLGPADAGKYATAIIIAGWFEIISNFGLNTLVIREVSKDRSTASHYLLNTTVLRLGTGLVGSLPVFIYLAGVGLTGNPLGADTTAAILMIMFGMIFSGMGQGLAGLYYAYETAEFPATITTVTTILKVGFGVVALLLGYGFVGLAAVSILVNIITLLILLISAFRHFSLSGPWKVDFPLQRQMVGQSYPLMLNHFFAVIFFQIDIPLLRQYNGEEVVGWYNSAYKWVNAFNVIPSFFTFALFPVISRQVTSGLANARRTFRMSLKLMLLISLPLAAITTFAAPLLIGLLGGEEFLPHGAIALQLIMWSIPIGWMNSVTNYVLIALGVEKRLTNAFIAGVAFNIITNLIFLPRYSYVAASITTILSEIVLLFLFALYLRPVMPDVRWNKLLIRPLAVTALMLWVMVLGSQVNLIVGVIAGIIAYPVGLLLLRVFGEEEKRILSSLLPERIMARLAPFL